MSKYNPAFPIPEPLQAYVGQFKGRCVVCKMPAYFNGILDGANIVHGAVCTRCGSYSIPFPLSVHPKLRTIEDLQVANISGYIRENSGVQIASESDIDFLLGLSTPSAAEKASKLLAALAKHHPTPGTVLHIKLSFIDNQVNHFLANMAENFPSDPAADHAALEMFPALSASWSHDEAELRFLLVDYLCKGMGFIEEAGYTDGGQTMRFKISPKGWDHLQSSGISNSSTGFVAMWFDAEMQSAWEKAFYPAIKSAGYSPLRIDKKEHNNKIDDEIMASIRGSRFIVADFTGERGGVYFEAGYAGGLGKPVIWTVRKDWLNRLHFDTRQFNHITWSEDNLEGFTEALRLRIEATIGKGTFR